VKKKEEIPASESLGAPISPPPVTKAKRKAPRTAWKKGESGNPKGAPRGPRNFRTDLIEMTETRMCTAWDHLKGEFVEVTVAEGLRLRILQLAMTGMATNPDGTIIALRDKDASDFARWASETVAPTQRTEIDMTTTTISGKPVGKLSDAELATLIERELRATVPSDTGSETTPPPDTDAIGA